MNPNPTNREWFAVLILAAMIVRGQHTHGTQAIAEAVWLADELLDKLNSKE